VLAKMDYVPANMKVASPLKGVRILQTDPIRTLDESDKWTALFETIVLNRAGN
jgi:iron(III) transport system substrate-binding protein